MEGKYVSLITYKKSGDPIATQVWFVEEDEKLYIVTVQERYKFKRIKNNQNVQIAPASMRGKPKGDYIDGIARILSDDESRPIVVLFRKKYRLFKMMFKEAGEGEKKSFFIEITLK
jgi:PPOX class probable F420-dependent enzyme